MSGINHTPGPWRTCKPNPMFGGYGYVVADTPNDPDPYRTGDNQALADYVGHLIAESICPQNVALIAAAPDLLRACLLAMAYCGQGLDEEIVFEGETYSEPQFLAEVVASAVYDALKKAGVETENMEAQEIADLAQTKQQGADQ